MDNRCVSVKIGDIGEAHAIYEFIKLGIPVCTPINNSMVYDLIIDYYNRLYKIQVKTTERLKDGKYVFDLSKLDVREGRNKRYSYTSEEIDFYYLYCIESGKSALLHISDAPQTGIVLRDRLNAPLNNQVSNVRYIEDYSILNILKMYVGS